MHDVDCRSIASRRFTPGKTNFIFLLKFNFKAAVNQSRETMKRRTAILLCTLFIFVEACATANAIGSISLSGTTGLIHIPTADVIPDQQVTIGLGYVNRHSAYLETGRCDNYPLSIVIGYLPRLEFSAGVNFVPGRKSYDGTKTYKDGVVSLQYLVLKEKKILPAIAVGARDIYSFILLNTTFIVTSKTILQNTKTAVRIHLGYGSDIIDHHLGVPKEDRDYPVGHTIVGLFGGLEINWNQQIIYMLEYDSQKMSAGFRFRMIPHLGFDVCFLRMKDVSAGMNFSFNL